MCPFMKYQRRREYIVEGKPNIKLIQQHQLTNMDLYSLAPCLKLCDQYRFSTKVNKVKYVDRTGRATGLREALHGFSVMKHGEMLWDYFRGNGRNEKIILLPECRKFNKRRSHTIKNIIREGKKLNPRYDWTCIKNFPFWKSWMFTYYCIRGQDSSIIKLHSFHIFDHHKPRLTHLGRTVYQ